jgi:hypothetical protein
MQFSFKNHRNAHMSLAKIAEVNVPYYSVQSRFYATTSRWANMPGPSQGDGSVNTFPQQQTRMQEWHNNQITVFYVVHAERL